MNRVCVFAGSNKGNRPEYAAAARELGGAILEQQLGLVYGGGNVGLMGVLADTVMSGGGHAIGVMPEALVAKEVAHRGLSELRVVKSMHERKAMMAELSHGFVALPGGFGTLEEFFEVLTWAQLGMHRKPCALFNVQGYFDGLLTFIEHSAAERFARPEHAGMILVGDCAGELLGRMESYAPPVVEKWIERSQT